MTSVSTARQEPDERVGAPTGGRIARAAHRALAHAGVLFFLVACTVAYEGQLHRDQSGDTYGTVYSAVAMVQSRTIFLDEYLPYIQARSGEKPFMLTTGSDGRVVSATPLTSSVLAVPVVALFTLFGTDAGDFDTWMEAGMLTAALMGAAAAAALFVLLTRLTTRRRASLITCLYAFGTLAWGVNGQALWQHGGAALALVLALLFLVDRRFVLAGLAMLAMVAFRPSTPVLIPFLLPLLGLKPANWLRFAAGTVPVIAAVAVVNWSTFSSATSQGYGSGHLSDSATPRSLGRILEGAVTLLVSPGRGLLVYSPILVFALAGLVLGFRRPVYRWCGIAALAYALAIGNLGQWSGNECFGARKLAESLPLYAVLLVPVLDRVLASRRLRRLFALAAVWSVGVQVLAAAMWPPPTWFGDHDLQDTSVWWSLSDNEIVAMLREPYLVPRVAAMVALLAVAVAAGLVASWLWHGRRRAHRGIAPTAA